VRVLLGVSGGIAAYKAAELVRRLRGLGCEVRCAATASARSFVAPLTLEVLSGRPVLGEEYLTPTGSGEEGHIEAAAWADVLCVAPATAHVLARLALGLADDFLTTAALAFEGPLVLAPAMHTAMWAKPAVQEHAATLSARGARFVGPVLGPLASGEVGMGRMADPQAIADAVLAAGAAAPARRNGSPAGRGESPETGDPLAGRRILVTAGPTHEPLDPVRFLGNRSSGRMGFALAAEAARRGARVVLVAGPVALPTPSGVERIDVVTAAEMEAAVARAAPAAELVVMAAAVADFRPRAAAPQKLKKERGIPTLDLEPTPDILGGLRELAPGAVLVGFAAETEDLEGNARAKLARKRADFLVANDVSRQDIAFGAEANEVTVYRRDGPPVFFAREEKGALAGRLLDPFSTALDPRRASVPAS
jgi:phosphopantothenoylcysteine decarboxylase / phosphopantothenate---cysteine ligase